MMLAILTCWEYWFRLSLLSSKKFGGVNMTLAAELKNISALKHKKKSASEKILPLDLLEAIKDSRERKNLHGPFQTAEDAVKSMLED